MRKQESARPTVGSGRPGRLQEVSVGSLTLSSSPMIVSHFASVGKPHLAALARQAQTRAHRAGVLANDAKRAGDVAGFERWRKIQARHQAIFRAAVRPGQGGDHAPEES